MATLGFIGLGVMGQPMASHLLQAGHDLVVYARQTARAQPLLAAGARAVASPLALAQVCQTVFLNLTDDAAVADVVFTAGHGLADGLVGGSVVVDMGTTSPVTTRDMAHRLAQARVAWVDAPVSGGEAGARAATLSIMVGGPQAAVDQVWPLLMCLGSRVVHVGDTGAGQVAKACNQIAVSASLLGVAEALTFATAQGVDAGRVREALMGGFANSRILEHHGQRMLDRDFQPGFRAQLHQKDLGLVLESARQANLALPATALAAQLVNALVGEGGGDLDSSALIRVVERLSGLGVGDTPVTTTEAEGS